MANSETSKMTATVTCPCPDCDGSATLDVGQNVVSGRLVWWESFRCPDCGRAAEADGDGVPGPFIRRSVICEGGLWGWHVRGEGAPLTATLSSVRQALGLSLAEAAALKGRLPGLWASGTRAEMGWLSGLADTGIESSIVPLEIAPAGAIDMTRFEGRD